MKNALFMAALLAIGSVHAQDYSATANNTAASQSQSAAGAISGASGNITSIGGSDLGVTISESATTEGSDMNDMVPNVFAPSLTAGSNLCAMSLSAGGSGGGFGLTLGGTYESNDCNVRENLRVMGALLRKDGNTQAASILKNISCQGVILWDAMELAAMETGNADLACKNERPKEMGRFQLRPVADLPKPYDTVVVEIPEGNKIRSTASANENDDFMETYGGLF